MCHRKAPVKSLRWHRGKASGKASAAQSNNVVFSTHTLSLKGACKGRLAGSQNTADAPDEAPEDQMSISTHADTTTDQEQRALRLELTLSVGQTAREAYQQTGTAQDGAQLLTTTGQAVIVWAAGQRGHSSAALRAHERAAQSGSCWAVRRASWPALKSRQRGARPLTRPLGASHRTSLARDGTQWPVPSQDGAAASMARAPQRSRRSPDASVAAHTRAAGAALGTARRASAPWPAQAVAEVARACSPRHIPGLLATRVRAPEAA